MMICVHEKPSFLALGVNGHILGVFVCTMRFFFNLNDPIVEPLMPSFLHDIIHSKIMHPI